MATYTDPDGTTETDAVARLAVASVISNDLADDLNVLLVPDGYSLKDLDAYADAPRRTSQTVVVSHVASFERYLDRFHSAEGESNVPNAAKHLAVFANPEAGTFKAVLDYHAAGSPAHGGHTCTLQLTPSDEWKTWTEKSGKKMSQAAFAEFVEANADDIAEPAGASVLEAALHIQAVRNVQFQSKVNLDRGDLVFAFSSETKGKGEAAFPERIALGIAPFEGGPVYRVAARVRYRVSDEGDLSLWYDLLDGDDALRTAAREVLVDVERVAGAANVFVGSAR